MLPLEIIKALFKKEHSYFALAVDAKRRTHVLLAILVLFVILILSAGGSILSSKLIFDKETTNILLKSFYNGFSVFILLILFTWLFVKFVEKRSFKTLGFLSGNVFKKYSKGFILGVLLQIASFLLIWMFIDVKSTAGRIQPNFLYPSLTVLAALIFFIIQGASEEIVFRGWFMQTIGWRHWPWLGFLLSMIFFVLAHSPNAGYNVLPYLNLVLVSTFLSIYILKEKNLWGVCGIHTGWNWTMGNVLGLSVSGNEKLGDSVFNLSLNGNEILTGGKFGIEASIIVTIIFGVGIIWQLIKYKNPNRI